MNTDGFQAFVDSFAKKYPADFHVLQVDNAKFHCAAKLELPDNMMLLYQPPYSPEVNPIEQVWSWVKGKIAGEIFETVDHLKERVNNILAGAGNAIFQSIVHRKFILDALFPYHSNFGHFFAGLPLVGRLPIWRRRFCIGSGDSGGPWARR
ncbi:MAG: transposase, partial [Methylococcaceae bacterium]|nr:transposase [Methylococcaceae bacterium]